MLNVLFVYDDVEHYSLDKAEIERQEFKVCGQVSVTAPWQSLAASSKISLLVFIVEALSIDLLKQITIDSGKLRLPVIIYTNTDNSAVISYAIETGVNAYVVDKFNSKRFPSIATAAMTRHALFNSMERELIQTKQMLEERKIIEKAKGLLMKQHGMDEDAAFRFLQKTAMEKNRKVIDIARMLIDALEMLSRK